MAQDPSDLFEYVRRTYFPRWDRARRWSVQYVDDLPPMMIAECNLATRQISFSPDVSKFGNDEMMSTLIHEICHAVVRSRKHDKVWLKRMLKACKIAESKGSHGVCACLLTELKYYLNVPIVGVCNEFEAYIDEIRRDADVAYQELREKDIKSMEDKLLKAYKTMHFINSLETDASKNDLKSVGRCLESIVKKTQSLSEIMAKIRKLQSGRNPERGIIEE